MNSALIASLAAVADVMQAARAPWWIIGSAAVAIHGGGPINVADIDVLLSVKDARLLFSSMGIDQRQGSDHPDFHSELFGLWLENPLPVEFMAGFCHRVAADWQTLIPSTRQAIAFGASTVFVPERWELSQILRAFGRPKDLERARLIAEWADPLGEFHLPF